MFTKQAHEDSKELTKKGVKGVNAFHALPYWEKLLIKYVLICMHYFGNIAATVQKHIFGQKTSYISSANLKEENFCKGIGLLIMENSKWTLYSKHTRDDCSQKINYNPTYIQEDNA